MISMPLLVYRAAMLAWALWLAAALLRLAALGVGAIQPRAISGAGAGRITAA